MCCSYGKELAGLYYALSVAPEIRHISKEIEGILPYVQRDCLPECYSLYHDIYESIMMVRMNHIFGSELEKKLDILFGIGTGGL